VLADIYYREQLFKGNAVSWGVEPDFFRFCYFALVDFYCHILELGI